MKPRGIYFLFILLLFVMSAVLPLGLAVWVKQEVEHRMKFKIEGHMAPHFFQFSFGLQNVHFQWDDKVRLVSGHLKVHYDLLAFLGTNRLRVKLSSQDLRGELLGEWAQMEGVGEVKFDRFFADLGIGPEGLQGIYRLDVESPTIQLHFGKALPVEGTAASGKEQRS